MDICITCGERRAAFLSKECNPCMDIRMRKSFGSTRPSSADSFDQPAVGPGDVGYSFLSLVFFLLAGLSLLGGIVLCSQLWPGDPGYGKEWKTLAYIPAITWLTAGIVQLSLFAAFGQGLHYLKQIVSNTRKPNKSIQPTANASAD